jgi:propionate CoA-transferase
VFRLSPEGLELIEVAPGIDIERDILARMEFAPIVRRDPELMDAAIFQPETMNLRERMIAVPLERRLAYDEEHNILFLNFERLSVKTSADVQAIHAEIERRLKSIGHKVYGIVNYDHFDLDPHLEEEYAAMVKSLVENYYFGVSRYTTSGFLRAKLGKALDGRGVAPHIYESASEALAHIRDQA